MTLEHHLQKLIWQAADPANPSFRAAFERDQDLEESVLAVCHR